MGESMETSSPSIGGCEGPDAMYVKLISSDDHEFIVKREHALSSGTIKVSYKDSSIPPNHSQNL